MDAKILQSWANEFGIGLTLFYGWKEFVEQALFWSVDAKPIAANKALKFIHQRLINVEVSQAGIELWQGMIAS